MMNFTKKLLAIIALVVASVATAQDFTAVDTTIILNPGEWIPADTGYFKMGVDKDLVGEDGIPEHYDKCFDAYGDDDHREGGMQNGWEYGNVIIFRSCDTSIETVDDVIKGTPPSENWPSEGNIIQLGKHKYALLDSARSGYLISPSIQDLNFLEVKVSTDLSINPNRTIWMLIEASLDGGNTWEYIDNVDGTAFIYQQLTNQGGDIHTYTVGNDDGFDAIVEASKAGPIKIRISPILPPFTQSVVVGESGVTIVNGERLKIWEVTIKGKTAPPAKGVSSNSLNIEPFRIIDGEFVAAKGLTLHVYNMSGTKLGSGSNVPVCNNGLYIVKTSNGITKKIYLK